MKNTISKKIIASVMLTTFVFSNASLAAFAMEDAGIIQYGETAKPVIRQEVAENTLRLKGDVSFTDKNIPISISLRDSDVKQVLRMFADKAGKNIIFHNSVNGTVTLDLVDVPLNSAFEMIMEISELNYVLDGNTIIIARAGTSDFNLGKQEMTSIPVKYVGAAALADFLNKNIFAMKKPGLSDTDIIVTNPVTNELLVFGNKNDVEIVKKVVEKFDKKPQTTTFKVNHTTPAEMADMICNMLLPATGAGASGGGGGASSGSGSSSSSDSSSDGGSTGGAAPAGGGAGGGGAGGGGALALNTGTVACTLEGKVDGTLSSLGLQNLAVSYYSGLGTINIVGGSEHQLEMIKDFITKTDKKQPQAYLEVSIVELNEEGSKELTNTWTVMSNSFSASFDGSSTSTDSMYPIFFKGNGWTLVDPESFSDGKYEEVGKVGKWNGPLNIMYTINYLVQNGKARVVVNPRIIITNGVESKIEVTQDYLESVEVDSSTSTGGTVVTRDYNVADDQGVTVGITPFISPDGYVTLNIVPEYSTEIGDVTGQESINGQIITYRAATLLSHRNLDLKNVRIKDGETLVIAGMIQEKESKTINKIPVLGDLPLVGALFRTTVSSKSKSEMVIMITPKIITDTEDAIGNTDTL